MILQEDRNARNERGERQYIVREAQTVYMQHVRSERAHQLAKTTHCIVRRVAASEGKKMVVHAIARQLLRMDAGLNHGDSDAGPTGTFSHIGQGRPIAQHILRQPRLRVGKEADLNDVQVGFRFGYRPETRGSQRRMNRFEKLSSHGRS